MFPLLVVGRLLNLRKWKVMQKLLSLLHVMKMSIASTQYALTKVLPKEDPDFEKIREECKDEVTQMFVDAVNQEKAWADYLFKDGLNDWSNAKLLQDYIEWICCKRMTALGMAVIYCTSNHLGHKNGLQEQKSSSTSRNRN